MDHDDSHYIYVLSKLSSALIIMYLVLYACPIPKPNHVHINARLAITADAQASIADHPGLNTAPASF